MLLSPTATMLLAAGGFGCLRGWVVNHQPTAISKSKRSPTATVKILRELRLDTVSDLATTEACFSQDRTMRNKSIGTEIFFKSVGASFSKRASSAFRICRSTSIDTQIPPAFAKGSI